MTYHRIHGSKRRKLVESGGNTLIVLFLLLLLLLLLFLLLLPVNMLKCIRSRLSKSLWLVILLERVQESGREKRGRSRRCIGGASTNPGLDQLLLSTLVDTIDVCQAQLTRRTTVRIRRRFMVIHCATACGIVG